MHRFWEMYILLLGFIILPGCSATSAKPDPQELDHQSTAASSQLSPEEGTAEPIAQLQRERSDNALAPKFTIGPGDLLKISEPDLKELNQAEVRVSPENTIELPLIGVMNVTGMTEDQLRGALQTRLSSYVKDPQVEVFVQQYHNRQVAVIGMVRKPGLYTIESRTDTIQDMIGRAGGMTENASSRILFIPASPGSNPGNLIKTTHEITHATRSDDSDARRSSDAVSRDNADSFEAAQTPEAAEEPSNSQQNNPGFSLASLHSHLQQDPISIDVAGRSGAGELDIPVRPGDLLIVPPAGEVLVDGWVQKPGAYKISNGMTATAAISAAGGAMFSSSAEVLRTGADGHKTAFPFDLSKVKSGEQSDVPIQAGDIVLVRRSALGLAPYSIYELFQKFGTGMFVPF
jgi:polysaccharide export outer membrane protein